MWGLDQLRLSSSKLLVGAALSSRTAHHAQCVVAVGPRKKAPYMRAVRDETLDIREFCAKAQLPGTVS